MKKLVAFLPALSLCGCGGYFFYPGVFSTSPNAIIYTWQETIWPDDLRERGPALELTSNQEAGGVAACIVKNWEKATKSKAWGKATTSRASYSVFAWLGYGVDWKHRDGDPPVEQNRETYEVVWQGHTRMDSLAIETFYLADVNGTSSGSLTKFFRSRPDLPDRVLMENGVRGCQ